MLGDAGVGKTSLVRMFATGQFDMNQPSTIGASFLSKSVSEAAVEYKLQIWDTAGQEKYMSLSEMYTRNADCLVMVYNVNSRKSFERAVEFWHSSVTSKPKKRILIGNKTDLEGREVSSQEGREAADRLGYHFYELTAQSQADVDDAFHKLVFRSFMSRDTGLRMLLTKHKPKTGALNTVPEGPFSHLLSYLH